MSPWNRGSRRSVNAGVGGWILLHRRRHLPLAVGFEILEVLLLGVRGRREHGVGLEPQELRPGGPDPTRRRAESAFSEHRGDGRGRDVDAELPSDPQVAPPGVLSAQPKDRVLDRGIERRTTGRPRATPASCLQEVPVPSRQGLRADQEALPPVPGQGQGCRCEERPIRRGEEDSPAASAEDLQLVAEDHGLEIQLIEAAADEQAEQPAQKPVPDRPEHQGSLRPCRQACERPGRSIGRVSLPHRVAALSRTAWRKLQAIREELRSDLRAIGDRARAEL